MKHMLGDLVEEVESAPTAEQSPMAVELEPFVKSISEPEDFSGFKKSDHVLIKNYQQKYTAMEKDRLSSKFNRRDVSFFDLYAK